ncbi:ribokinase [Thermoanaerobacteraceae bacterium SP2]|jgi:ribokinase|nr:ribokinase [Thermoanaerobacteraceae bacterium SP2]
MITVVGSSNIDYIISNKKLPEPGETIYGTGMFITAGGKGANQAAAAARLGADVCFLSKVGGNDKNSEILWEKLKWAGVNIDNIEVEENTYCGYGFVMVSEDGQNRIIIIKGANEYITPQYVEKHKETIINSKICMSEFMIPIETAEYAISIAHNNGVVTILNPAPAFPIDDRFYKKIDIITPNEIEARDISGVEIKDKKSAVEAANYFHAKGVKNVLITLGSRGSFISDGTRQEFIKSYNVKAIDTSGAGDSFNGGLAYSIWKGKDIFEAAHFATAVAAVSVTRQGTMPSMPTLSEVEDLIKSQNAS